MSTKKQSIHVDRAVWDLADWMAMSSAGQSEVFRETGDPLSVLSSTQHTLGGSDAGKSICFGRILLALPHLGWYSVSIEQLGSIIPCCQLSSESTTGLGPTSTSCLQPGTEVMVYRFPGGSPRYGVILGSLPAMTQDGSMLFPDYTVQAGNTGFKKEGYFQSYIQKLKDLGGAMDWAAGRPLDQNLFDHGVTTFTGVGYHVDPLFACLRVDETCGLFLHYHDRHTVLAGQSLQVVSSAHVEEFQDDCGELVSFRGEALYPWEAVGRFQPEQDAGEDNTATDVVFDRPVAAVEPSGGYEQTAFYRYQEYGGYLGQGRMRQMSLPPQNPTSEFWTFGSSDIPVTVFREQILPDGTLLQQSAKQMIFAKRAAIAGPIAKRLREDYSDEADNPTNYRASGQGSNGVEHIAEEPQLPGSDPSLSLAAALADVHAWAFNWAGTFPFHYHSNDYELPEESELPLNKVQMGAPDYSALVTGHWLPDSGYQLLRVDDVRGNARYFEAASHISLLEDGNVVLGGGGGCQLSFINGNAILDAPGGFWVRVGKSIINLAGDDIIHRAANSIDQTAGKDIRQKAEVNLLTLSGNSGYGGTLLENRAHSNEQHFPNPGGEAIRASGVVVKTAAGPFAALSGEIYLQTRSGPLVLDANRGLAPINTVSSQFHRYMRTQASDIFLDSRNQVINSHYWNSTGASINGSVQMLGNLQVSGSGLFKYSVATSDGHFASPAGGQVGQLLNSDAERVKFDTQYERATEAKESFEEGFSTSISERYYLSGKIGNSDQQALIEFGLRTDSNYGTLNLRMPAALWQQQADATQAGQLWNEPDVLYHKKPQIPWPGKAVWEGASLLMLTPEQSPLYDWAAGRDKPRGDGAYERPQLPAMEPVVMKEHYRIFGG